MTDAERPATMRRRTRRRWLDNYQQSPDRPGKTRMLDVAVPEQDGVPLAPELRALVDDRLSQAGLDVWAPRVTREGGCC